MPAQPPGVMRNDLNVLPPELSCVMVGQESVIGCNNEYQTLIELHKAWRGGDYAMGRFLSLAFRTVVGLGGLLLGKQLFNSWLQ